MTFAPIRSGLVKQAGRSTVLHHSSHERKRSMLVTVSRCLYRPARIAYEARMDTASKGAAEAIQDESSRSCSLEAGEAVSVALRAWYDESLEDFREFRP